MDYYTTKRWQILRQNDIVRIDTPVRTIIGRVSSVTKHCLSCDNFEKLHKYNISNKWTIRPAHGFTNVECYSEYYSNDNFHVNIRKANLIESLMYLLKCSKLSGIDQYLIKETYEN